jgi:hypothetical protein
MIAAAVTHAVAAIVIAALAARAIALVHAVRIHASPQLVQ